MTRNQYKNIADTLRHTSPIASASAQAHKQYVDTYTALAKMFLDTDPKFPWDLFVMTCTSASVQWSRR